MTTNNTKSGREADISVEKQRRRILVLRMPSLKMFRSNERNVLTANIIDSQVINHFHIAYKSKYLKKHMKYDIALN